MSRAPNQRGFRRIEPRAIVYGRYLSPVRSRPDRTRTDVVSASNLRRAVRATSDVCTQEPSTLQSLRAVSGPVRRLSIGSVDAMTANEARTPRVTRA